jgi:hypothetical protein
MRWVVPFLCVCLLGTTTAIAQGQAAPDSRSGLPLPASVASSQPVIETPPAVEETSDCFYVEVGCLLRWFKPVCASVPIVAVGNPQAAIPGAVGQPGTQILVGRVPPHKFEFPLTPGMQATVGWDRGDGAIGLEVSGFFMAQASNSQHFTAAPNGSPNSYLPYQAPDNSFQALPFTIPGVVTGSSAAVGSTRLWGIEGNVPMPFTVDRGTYILHGAFLIGGRYLDLTDRVRITNSLSLVDDPSAFAIGMDQFSTHNQFAGPQVGTTIGVSAGRWSVELTSKLAGGVTHQTRNIDGSPLLSASVVSPLLVPGPIQVLPSNINHETADRVTLVPEIGIKTQVALTSWCSLSLGYSLLYWNKVLCPGDQMSPLVNITQLPFHGPVSGSLDPKPQFEHTDYFAQGMNVAIQFRY